MGTRKLVVAVAGLVGASVALLSLGSPSFSRGPADGPPPPGKGDGAARRPEPAGARKVVIKRLEPADADGMNAEVRVDLPGSAAPLVSRIPRLATRPDAEKGRVVGRFRLDFQGLHDDQGRYATDLGEADRLVAFAARARARPGDLRGALEPVTIEPGRERELPAWRGYPSGTAFADDVIIRRCLMITDLGVVEDPSRTRGDGPWTFGHLMAGIANTKATGIDPAALARRWLASWEEDQEVNGSAVLARRDGIRRLIIGPWEQASGGPGHPLDLTKAPFRLLAIISQLDLRDNLVLETPRIGGGGAGEARFVFCALGPDGKALPFTVIFEYGIKKQDFEAVRHWASRWYELRRLKPGEARYNAELEQLTRLFTDADADVESPPDRSALSQLRTNEIALVLPPAVARVVAWEIREFRVDVNNGGYLRQVTVKGTPDIAFNGTPSLADFANQPDVERAILANAHSVPVEFPPGRPFLGGSAITARNMFWAGAPAPGNIRNPEARHLLSLGTCNGCHAGETFPQVSPGTPPDGPEADIVPTNFTHVKPRAAGKEARLSPFLTGKDADGKPFELPDPVTGEKRAFGDLERRAQDLRALVRYGWYYELQRLPLQMTH